MNLTPERWQHIARIYELAIEVTPADRDAFLSDACGNDEELRREVDSLLRHDATTFVLDRSIWTMAASLLNPGAVATNTMRRLASGTTLGPYTILDVAGVGAMGEVYRARDARLNRDVAIKVLPLEFARDMRRLARFKREARALGPLNHPGIAGIHHVLEDADGSYLVMEFVEGEDLARRLREGALPLAEVLRIGQEIAAALQAAHAKAIVHRDLKPANIRLTPDGQVKLLDFGIALSVSDREEDVAAVANSGAPTRTLIAGAPAYMSPEQAAGRPVDPRTDVWAFGCVLYELLTGRKAFVAAIESSTPHVLRAEPDWTGFPSDAPPALIQLIRRCLRRDAAERVGDAAELQRTLAEIAGTHRDHDSHKQNSEDKRSGRWLSIAAGVLLLGAAGGVALLPVREAHELRVAQTRQITFAPELELDPALSPDGARVAYAVQDATRTDIHVRPVAGGESINLTRDLAGWSIGGLVGHATVTRLPSCHVARRRHLTGLLATPSTSCRRLVAWPGTSSAPGYSGTRGRPTARGWPSHTTTGFMSARCTGRLRPG